MAKIAMHFGQCKKSPPREASLQGVNSIVMHFWGKQKSIRHGCFFFFPELFFLSLEDIFIWLIGGTEIPYWIFSFVRFLTPTVSFTNPSSSISYFITKILSNGFWFLSFCFGIVSSTFIALAKISILEQAMFQCITSSPPDTSRRSGRRNRIRWNLWRGMWELHLVFESDDVVRIVHSQQTPLPLSSACYPAWWYDLINATKIRHFCKFSK